MSKYNLNPTEKLAGLHMIGTVSRRFLISYGVDPDVLYPYLPPKAELSLYKDLAWISACFVDIGDMRPSILPRSMGLGFKYLIHRTRARLPYPNGELRESVLVLEANINRRLFSILGKNTTGVRFNVRDINLSENENEWTLKMCNKGEVLYNAVIQKSSIDGVINKISSFDNAQEADNFLLGVSYGGEWNSKKRNLKLLAETHDPWETLVGDCETTSNMFVESLINKKIEADHVITMTNIPHYFGLFGFDVKT